MKSRTGQGLGAILTVLLLSMTGCGGGGGGGTTSSVTNHAPTASAGRDVNAILGGLIQLDGTLSSDPDGDPLSYAWSLASKPAGSNANLTDSTGISPTLNADIAGPYTISLVVSDGSLASPADSVSITVLPSYSSIPDTGQQRCYNLSVEIPCPDPGAVFYGQDAQYSTNPLRFSGNSATVNDLTTGLTWQKVDDPAKYNWFQAAGVYSAIYNPATTDHCGSLILDGYSDWRLPSRRELVSIINYAQGAPDQSFFSNSGAYWSSTATNVNTAAWEVVGGLVGAGYGVTSDPLDVKCVRGTPWGGNSYVDNGLTVTDGMSGLVWQKDDYGSALNWQDALAYCENLTLGSSSDWRLPDVKELESLVRVNLSAPAIDLAFFPGTQSLYYWSSTTNDASPGAAWSIDFYNGTVYNNDAKIAFKMVRCVR